MCTINFLNTFRTVYFSKIFVSLGSIQNTSWSNLTLGWEWNDTPSLSTGLATHFLYVFRLFTGNKQSANVEHFLGEFITEINQLLTDGIMIENQHFQIRIKKFICDRPARAFIKCIIGHGGYYTCERCTIRGERVNGRTVYLLIDSPERTNISFRNQENPEHHNAVSPLITSEPAFDIVTQFSLDFLHLCCLGIGDAHDRWGRCERIDHVV